MNNIYNNLTIDNLIKTEWFNQFNKSQQKQILKGLGVSLDVSIYATTEFDWFQMRQIRLGLERKLNVLKYAKPEISGLEMETIQEKLWKESTH